MVPSQGSYYSTVALWEVVSVCLFVCLILTVMFELEVDTLHFYSRLAAIQWPVDTNLGTESTLCQTTIWKQVRGSNITSLFHLFN